MDLNNTPIHVGNDMKKNSFNEKANKFNSKLPSNINIENKLKNNGIEMKENNYLVEIVSVLNKKKYLKNISSNDLAEVLSENRLENKRTIFLPKNNY